MSEIEIILGDATNLSFIPNNSIDLIIAAPPFINRNTLLYGGNPKSQINFNSKKMLKLLIKSTKEMERVLKPTGNILIEISPEDGLIHKYFVSVLKKTSLIYVDEIIHKISNFPGYSKNDEFIHQNMVTWMHFIKDENKFYSNPFKLKKFNDPIWELNLTNSEDMIDKILIKEYPEIVDYSVIRDIPERFIEMYSKPGWTVLDLFAGSGTVSGVAYELNRNAICVDISKRQIEIATKRINLIKELK